MPTSSEAAPFVADRLMKRAGIVSLVSLVSLAAISAHAQSVDADRPGLLAATTVVGRGRAQVESGIQRSWASSSDSTTSLLNAPSVLRVGLSNTWELQVGHSLVNRVSERLGTDTRVVRGWGDLSLGVKAARPGEALTPGVVAYGTVGLPTGADEFTSGRPLVSGLLQLTWDLSERVSAGSVIGYARTIEAEAGVSAGLVGGSIGVSLPAHWATYVEAGAFPDASGDHAGTVGGGVTRIVRDRLQVDVSLNRGLSAPAAVWTLGAGVSVLF